MAKHLNVNLQFTADTSQAKAQIQSLQQSLTQLSTVSITGKGMTGYTQDIGKAISKVNELKSVLASATTSSGTLDLGQFNASMKKAGSSIQDYHKELMKLGPAGKQAFAQLAQSVSTASVPIKQTSGLLNEMAVTLKNTARWQLTSSLIHGFMSSLQGAMQYAQGLDKSLTDIRIVSGMSADEMERFAVQANKSAQALSSTTKKYADAALIYYQQGLSESEVKERTDVTIKMANVTGEAAADVSSYMTAIWNNFNKEGQYAEEHFADIMTRLGAETAASTDEIAAGLSKFSAIADTVGLSFDMASSAVTAVVDQTREAPEVVGTAMKTIFSRVEGLKMGETLEDGVDLNKYSSGLKKVGVDIFDATGNLKDMDDILHEIGDTWESLNREEQIALSQTVAGIRQYNQFMAIFDNWDKVEENLNMAAEAGGTLQEQADIYAESWEGARNRVKSAMEEIYGKIIDDDFFISLNNLLADFLGVISEVVDSLGGMKGVLLLLSTVMMKTFGQSMAAGINRMVYNFQSGTKKSKAEILSLRNDTNKLLTTMSSDGTAAGQAFANIFSKTAKVQQEIINQNERIAKSGRQKTADEEAFFQAVLQTNKAISDQYLNTAKLLDTQKQKENNISKDMNMAINRARIEQGLGNSQNDDSRRMAKFYQSRMKVEASNYAMGSAMMEKISAQTKGNYDLKTVQTDINSMIVAAKEAGVTIDSSLLARLKELSSVSNKADFDKAFNKLDQKVFDSASKLEHFGIKLEKVLTGQGISGDKAAQMVERLKQEFLTTGQVSEELIANFKALGIEVDAATGKINKMAQANITAGQKVMALSSMISSAAMALSSINGMIDTLKDPDATSWEKFLSILMTIGMTLPMLTSAFGTQNLMMIASIFNTSAYAAALDVVKAAEIGAATGAQAFGAALKAAFPPLLIITGIIAALVIAFKVISSQMNKASKEAKKAAETAEAMNKQYETAKTELEEVNQELEALREKRNALKELEEGTEEWNAALKDSNDYVLKLLDKYPELAEHVYTDENGVLQITDAGMEGIARRKEEEVEDARIASIQSNIKANDAQKEANIESTRKNITYSGNAQGGMASTQVEYTLDKSEFDSVIELVEKYGSNLPEDELMEVLGNDQDKYDAVLEYLPEIIALITENNALTKSNEIQSKEIGKSILEKTGDADAENAEQLSGIAAQEYQTEYDKVYDEWDNKGKSAIIDEYERLNPDMTLTNKNGSKKKAAEFKDANGNVVPITVEEMLDEIASTTAMDRVADKWDAVADKFNRVLDSKMSKNTSGDLAGSVWSGNKNDGYDYENYLTRGDLKNIHDSYIGEDGKFDATMAKGTDFNMTNEEAEARGYYASGEYSAADMWAQDYVSGANDIYKTNLQNRKKANNYYAEENGEAIRGESFTAREEDWYIKDNADGYDSRMGSLYTEYNWENDADPFSNRKAKRESGKTTEIEYRDAHVSNKERDQILSSGGFTMDQYKDQQKEFMKMDSVQQGFGTVKKDDGTAATYDEMTAAYEKYMEAKKEGKDIDKALTKEEKKLAKAYDENKEEIEDITANHFEMNEGLQEVADNHEKWAKGLEKAGTQEYVDTLEGMRGAMGKILNVSPDLISDTLLTAENLDLMTKAAQGDESALNQLRMTASKQYLVTCGFDGSELEQGEAFINRWAESINNTEVGMTPQLHDGDFLAELWNMKKQTGMSIGQINNLLSQMGMEPKITMVKKDFPLPDVPLLKALTGGKSSFTIKVPKITVKKKSSASNATFSSGGDGGSGGGGGGSGGGGGGGSRAPERKKLGLKDLDEELERYHVINNQLEDMEHKLDQISTAKDRAFGKNKLKAMDQEEDALENLLEKQREYQQEIQDYLQEDKDKLVDMKIGVQFDENGTITNYDKLIEDATKKYNDRINSYNAQSGSTQESWDKKYENAINKETGEVYGSYEGWAQAEFDKVVNAISQYEETQDLAKEVESKIQDTLNKIYDLRLEKVEYTVELKVDVAEDSLELIDFLMERIEDDAFKAAEQIDYLGQTIDASMDKIAAHRQGLVDLFNNHDLDGSALVAMLEAGDVKGFAAATEGIDFTEAEIDFIREAKSEILDNLSEIRDAQIQVIELVGEVFDSHMEEFDKIIEKTEHLQDVTNAYKEIVQLTGKKSSSAFKETMQMLNSTATDLAISQIGRTKAKYDEATREYNDALAQRQAAMEAGDEELVKHWDEVCEEIQDGMNDAQKEFMDAWIAGLEQAREEFQENMALIIEDFKIQMGGLAGSLDALSNQFDLHSQMTSNYLPDYERVYELNKLMRDINDSIDETDNVKAKRELLELEQEINKAREDGKPMSEYDLNYLRKRYELKVAELELKESKDAKSQVRMTKDSEGNFGYVYTADDAMVETAEQNYEDKLFEMQQMNAEYINTLQQSMIDLNNEYASQFEQLGELYEIGSAEYVAALEQLQAWYANQQIFYQGQLDGVMTNNGILYETEVVKYAEMTNNKALLDLEYISKFEQLPLAMLTGFTSMAEYQAMWEQQAAQMYDQAGTNAENFQTRNDEAMAAAGEDVETFSDTVQEEVEEIRTQNEQITTEMDETLQTVQKNWDDTIGKVKLFETQYTTTVGNLIKLNTSLTDSMNKMLAAWSGVKEEEIKQNQPKPTTSSTGGGGGGGGGGGAPSLRAGAKIGYTGRYHANSYGTGSSGSWYSGQKNKVKISRYSLRPYGNQSSGGRYAIHIETLSGGPLGWIKPSQAFDTGGYTGKWGGKEGRMAMLHQKEIVLNETDTANFLKTVEIVRKISQTIDLNALSSAGGLSRGLHSTGITNNNRDTLKQDVHITAEFPNATDKNEILQAFDNVINLAAQYANRK